MTKIRIIIKKRLSDKADEVSLRFVNYVRFPVILLKV